MGAETMRALRKRMRLSQTELGDLIGVDGCKISRCELGKTHLRPFNGAILDALDRAEDAVGRDAILIMKSCGLVAALRYIFDND
jgi:transcriptional regulator with XRE-family HTH domain